MDGTWLLVVPAETAVDLQLLETMWVVIQLAKVETSVCRINFDGSSANVTLFSSLKMLLFWRVVGCG